MIGAQRVIEQPFACVGVGGVVNASFRDNSTVVLMGAPDAVVLSSLFSDRGLGCPRQSLAVEKTEYTSEGGLAGGLDAKGTSGLSQGRDNIGATSSFELWPSSS